MPAITVNGFHANYTDTGPATGETILLLHAGGTSSAHWRKVAPLLDGDVRLIAPDLIGFGATDSWHGDRELTHDDQADLVAGLLDHLDVRSVHVVGHSYGGATATRLAPSPGEPRSRTTTSCRRRSSSYASDRPITPPPTTMCSADAAPREVIALEPLARSRPAPRAPWPRRRPPRPPHARSAGSGAHPGTMS